MGTYLTGVSYLFIISFLTVPSTCTKRLLFLEIRHSLILTVLSTERLEDSIRIVTTKEGLIQIGSNIHEIVCFLSFTIFNNCLGFQLKRNYWNKPMIIILYLCLFTTHNVYNVLIRIMYLYEILYLYCLCLINGNRTREN